MPISISVAPIAGLKLPTPAGRYDHPILIGFLAPHRLHHKVRTYKEYHRARICNCLWSPGIDSEESISPAYVAWQASTTNRVSYRPARLRIDTWSS
jgi:hypothetical protein